MTKVNLKRMVTAAIIITILAVGIVAFDTRVKVQHYILETDKIDESIRVALITDLHSCKYGEKEEELIQAVKAQKPDIVLMAGDICDDIIPNDNAEALLAGIANEYPCYYVTGNHEYWSSNIEGILALFEAYDVKVLSGTYDTITVKGQQLNICGVSDPDISRATYTAFGTMQQLEALKEVHENGLYTILMAHRPEGITSYLGYDFDLVVSGHAHGGQWRIPGLINGVYAPNQGWFPKYAGGQYDFENMTMIVSRGLAKESTRVPRIFNRPELVIINLQ